MKTSDKPTMLAEFKEWIGEEDVPRVPKGKFVGFRVGFFDIETTALDAKKGRGICGCIADSFGRVYTYDLHDKAYRVPNDPGDDIKWAIAFRDALESYDIIVGWNSGGFDLPFLNARLMLRGYRPVRLEIMHIDLMWKYGGRSRWSARVGGRSLRNVNQFYTFNRSEELANKLELPIEIWQRYADGDPKAHDLIVKHCQMDVLTTRDRFANTKPLITTIHR